jgi:hypothetical protein
MKDYCRRTVQEGKGCFVPFQYRKNVQTLTYKVGIPTLKKGLLKHTHNTIRTILTDKNKAYRVAWCCSFVCGMVSLLTYWRGWVLTRSGFTEQKLQKSYILIPGETPSHQTCKHKRHIKKKIASLQLCSLDRIPRWENGGTGISALVFLPNKFMCREIPKIDPRERLRQRVSRLTRKS